MSVLEGVKRTAQLRARTSEFDPGRLNLNHGAWRASLPARSNCANRGFAGTTVPGYFAPTGPGLGRLLRAGPVPAHFAPASPLLGASARARSLPAHLVRT